MRKLYFLIACIGLCGNLEAQIDDRIEFSVSDLQFNAIDDFTQLSFSGCLYTAETGYPQLPYLEVSYVIPYTKQAVSVTITDTVSQAIAGSFLLYPAQPDYPGNMPSPPPFAEPDAGVYTGHTPYPGALIEIAGQYYNKGYHIVTLHIYPVAYIPASRNLRMFSSIRFTLNVEDAEEFPLRPKRQSSAISELVRKQIMALVKNRDQVPAIPEENPVPAAGYCSVAGITPDFSGFVAPEYIIITNDTGVDGNPVPLYNNRRMTQLFGEFASWKTRKGVPTVIVTIDEIDEYYAGIDVQEKIHNFLKEVYENYGTMYVLFGGDVNIVPVRDVYNPSQSTDPSPTYVTDLYYTAVEKSWNTNGDAIYGGPGDSCDDTSEFYYGRVPVENGEETDIFIKKVMAYENLSNVADKSYINNMVCIEGHTTYPPRGNTVIPMVVLNPVLDRLTQSNIRTWKVYDHATSFSGDQLLNRIHVLQNLNAGQPFGRFHVVHHCDHGSYLAMGTSSKIQCEALSRSDMDGLTNAPYYQILYTNACNPGEFKRDCIIERYLNNRDGGGVAAIACSTTGHSHEISFFGNFTEKIYETSSGSPTLYNIGVVRDSSIPVTGAGVRLRVYHLFGDPEMPIWTREPQTLTVTLSATTLSNVNNQLQVTVGNMVYEEEVTVCLMKDNEIYLRQKGTGNPASKTFTFTIEPETAGTLYVTVTGHNYLPVERQVPVTITGKNLFVAGRAVREVVGNDDHELEAGETVDLVICLRNNGTVPVNTVSAMLSCVPVDTNLNGNDILTILTGNISFGDMPVYGNVIKEYRLSVKNNVPDGTWVKFILEITDNAGYTVTKSFLYQIKAHNVQYAQNNHLFESGQWSAFITVCNLGRGEARGVKARFYSDSPVITFLNDSIDYGNIALFESKTNTIPIVFTSTLPNTSTTVYGDFTDVYGKTWTEVFNLNPPAYGIENLGFTSTQSSVTLTWKPIPAPALNCKGYNIYRSDTEDGQFIRLNSFPQAGASMYTDNGLEIKTTYYYQVSYVDKKGNESAKVPVTAWTTLPYHPGWPVLNNADKFGNRNEGSPQAYDIDGDGYDELFFTQYDYSFENRGGIFAFTHLGEELYDIDHNPTTTSGFADIGARVKSTPALADIDHDGIIEVIVTTMQADNNNASSSMHVYKTTQDLNHDQKPDLYWKSHCGRALHGAIIAPFRGNSGTLECLISKTWNYPIDVIPIKSHTGSLYQNLPLNGTSGDSFNGDHAAAAVGDLDNNGTIEIVIGYESGLYLYEKNSLGNYVLKWSYKNIAYPDMASPVVLADLDKDGDLEIIFVMKKDADRVVCAKHHDGSFVTGWSVNNQDHLILSDGSWLSVGDLDRDGFPEVVIGSPGKVYAWKRSGAAMPNFPITVPGLSMSGRAPLIADIDGYNDVELILASNNGGIYAYKTDGTPVLGFPLNSGTVYTPCIADIDHDGKSEIIAAGNMTFHVWDTEGDPDRIEWGRVRFDERNTGAYKKECTYLAGSYQLLDSEIWTERRKVYQDIVIPSGKTLTIQQEVSLSSDARIVIHPGGKLIVDGGKLTNRCSDFWQGIVVLGDNTQGQLDSKQGVVELKNGAIIENAVTGILVGSLESGNAQNGGIIRASGSSFINCLTGVRIKPYLSKSNYHFETGSRSSFTSCTFSWNENMQGVKEEVNPKPLSQVILAEVGNVVFKGCHFVNDRFTDRVTHGIYASDAKFEVTAVMEKGVVPHGILERSNFDGFIYGIRTEKTIPSANRFTKVEYTDFNTNTIGIFNNGVDNSVFKHNTFKIGNPPGVLFASDEPYMHEQQQYPKSPVFSFKFGTGITLNGSTGYDIRFNDFNRIQSPVYLPIGVLIKNSGKAPNEIKSNRFDSLYTAILCNGNNQSLNDSYSGLQLLCNTFGENTEFAIQIDNTGSGIAQYQGHNNRSAGNIFRQENPGAVGHIYNTSEIPVVYFYNQNRPDEQAWQISEHVILSPITASGGCASSSTTSYNSVELAMAEAEFANIKYNYNSLIDGGSTNQLLAELELSWNMETWKIRDNLMQKSPYLSEKVIREVAEKNLLPHAMLLEVCLANPEATRDATFIKFLKEDIANPMPEYMCELIVANQDEKTFRTVLEASVNTAESNLEIIARSMVNAYSEDSTEYSVSAIVQILERIPNMEAILSLIDFWVYLREFPVVEDMLNNLKSLKLRDRDRLELEMLTEWYTFMRNDYPGDPVLLTEDKLESMKVLFLETDTKVAERIKSLLYRYSGCDYNYHIEPNIPNSGKPKIMKQNVNAAVREHCNNVTVQPNPAESFTTFNYELQPDAINAVLLITDSKGVSLLSVSLADTKGHYLWDTRGISSGVYPYTVMYNGQILNSGKVVVKK